MSARQVQITQGTPEWLAWRRPRMGASDSPALFGLSPYKTKRDLWFEKAGLGEPDDEDKSFIFRRGHEAEAELRELFSKYTKIEIKPACFENGNIFGASLDGYDKSLGILEAKLVGKDVLQAAAGGTIPEHHRIQIQHQLYTSESDKAYWGGKAPKSKDGVVVEIGRDERMIKMIIESVTEFWESLQNSEAPPLTTQDTLFITDKAQVEFFQGFAKLKKQKTILEQMYKVAEEKAHALATHTRVKCGDVTISEILRSGSVDYSKIPEIKALSSEYIESFRKKPSRYKTIRFGKGEE